MAKDTAWFPHDVEPTSDPKMQAMIGDYGAIGYGLYWRIIEMLHSDNEHKLPFKKYVFLAIAKQMQASAKQNKNLNWFAEITPDEVQVFVKDCVDVYELFISDDTHFFAERVFRNIERKENISNERSIAGKKGAFAKQMKANAKQTLAIREDKNREDYIQVESLNNSLNSEKNGKKSSPQWLEMMDKIKKANPDSEHLNQKV